MNKLEELIKAVGYNDIEYGEYNGEIVWVKCTIKGIEMLINSAVLEKDIKIDILEQEVDSWKNVFSKELVEEQKEKDAEIAGGYKTADEESESTMIATLIEKEILNNRS